MNEPIDTAVKGFTAGLWLFGSAATYLGFWDRNPGLIVIGVAVLASGCILLRDWICVRAL